MRLPRRKTTTTQKVNDLFQGTAHALCEVVNVKTDRQRCTIYCGRAMPAQGFPEGSIWANPFKISKADGTEARGLAIRNYEARLLDNPLLLLRLAELRGQVLGCWCKPLPCHCDVLARWANGSSRAILEAHFKARRTFGRNSEPAPSEGHWLEWLQKFGALPASLKSWRSLEEAEAAPALEFLRLAHARFDKPAAGG